MPQSHAPLLIEPCRTCPTDNREASVGEFFGDRRQRRCRGRDPASPPLPRGSSLAASNEARRRFPAGAINPRRGSLFAPGRTSGGNRGSGDARDYTPFALKLTVLRSYALAGAINRLHFITSPCSLRVGIYEGAITWRKIVSSVSGPTSTVASTALSA